jgi:hypothetical protein
MIHNGSLRGDRVRAENRLLFKRAYLVRLEPLVVSEHQLTGHGEEPPWFAGGESEF